MIILLPPILYSDISLLVVFLLLFCLVVIIIIIITIITNTDRSYCQITSNEVKSICFLFQNLHLFYYLSPCLLLACFHFLLLFIYRHPCLLLHNFLVLPSVTINQHLLHDSHLLYFLIITSNSSIMFTISAGSNPGSGTSMGSHGLHSIDRTFRRMWLDPRRAIF